MNAKLKIRLTVILVLLLSLSLLTTYSSAQNSIQMLGTTERVSVASDQTQADDYSYSPSISADGRYVAFESAAANLVAGDTNAYCDTDGDNIFDDNCPDVFVHDRITGVTQRVSVATGGTQGNDGSYSPSISADGRYVAFDSWASNLVVGDTNGAWDVFVHDRATGETTLVSVASDATQGNGNSWSNAISADGRYVAFQSLANNLVGGDANGNQDVFVHERASGVTTLVSVASDGTQGNADSYTPSISADGRYVAFGSSANNLVALDTNGFGDIFVHDREMGETQRVSVATDGTQGNSVSLHPSISADGNCVAFDSYASNLDPWDSNHRQDVFVHDRATGVTTRDSVDSGGLQGDADSNYPSISTDGRYVAFQSFAANLVVGDANWTQDVFEHDRATGETTLVSIASDGTQGDAVSYSPSVSASGRYVAFESAAANLVALDTNDAEDVFVNDQGAAPFPYRAYLPITTR